MLAKVLVVAGFTFVNIFLSNLLIGFVFFLADFILNFILEQLTSGTLTESILKMTLTAFAPAGMGLVPLYFGMKKKSVPVTIITAILLISLTNVSVDDFTLSRVLAIPFALGAIGVLAAYTPSEIFIMWISTSGVFLPSVKIEGFFLYLKEETRSKRIGKRGEKL